MGISRKPWQEELEIIDGAMRAISDITDPEELVSVYWQHIDNLIPQSDFVALSRRGTRPPEFLITRSSRFIEHHNPWTEREKLPRMVGGLLGELLYGAKPVVVDDLPARLSLDDPGHFYLAGFERLIALPQYDRGEALNMSVLLLNPGEDVPNELIPILHWQSGLFGRGTQNLVLRNQLSNALTALDQELQVVGEIQRSLLPLGTPDVAGLDIATHYLTSARAGGDYYDFFPIERDRWGVLIADVSGHGTPAAVLMAITRAISHMRKDLHGEPSAFLSALNQELAQAYTRAGTFVTAFYGVIDMQRCSLKYSAAGHNPPRLLRKRSIQSLQDAGMMPLGISEDLAYRNAEVSLDSGDTLLLYTDGITEAQRPSRVGSRSVELFGVERLDEALMSRAGSAAQSHIDGVRRALDEFTGSAPATDDQTALAIRCA